MAEKRRDQPTDSSTARGRRAESLAARYLFAQGMTILARNVRAGCGEIDLIARDGDQIVFVEVRSRRRGARFAAAATIDRIKRQRLVAAASAWLARHGMSRASCRFDVVAIETVACGHRRGDRLQHIKGAFVDDDEEIS
ncbi:MAG: YraN family protein [Acidobacteriota bacterium]|nr:MAG: YraN family protein [Acidobacteriota bacterium]